MPKATNPGSANRQERRHNPLEADLTATVSQKNKPAKRKSRHQDEGDEFVDSKASRKILRIAQDLADEDGEENPVPKANPAFEFESRFPEEDEEEVVYEDEEAWGDEEEEVEEIEIAPEDLATYNKFFPQEQEDDDLLKKGWPGVAADEQEEAPSTNLADLILEKIALHEAGQDRGAENEPGPIDEDFEIPEKVVEVYTK